MVGKEKNVADRIDEKGGGKIIATIKFLVRPLVENTKEFSEKKKYFVIAMENYFTFPKVLAMLKEFMIGVVGTVRFCPGLSGQNIKEIDDTQINFNELFWSVDSFETLFIKWMENVLVFLVTTVHNMMDIKNVRAGDQN